jgi:hypothetical protein
MDQDIVAVVSFPGLSTFPLHRLLRILPYPDIPWSRSGLPNVSAS